MNSRYGSSIFVDFTSAQPLATFFGCSFLSEDSCHVGFPMDTRGEAGFLSISSYAIFMSNCLSYSLTVPKSTSITLDWFYSFCIFCSSVSLILVYTSADCFCRARIYFSILCSTSSSF